MITLERTIIVLLSLVVTFYNPAAMCALALFAAMAGALALLVKICD